MNKILDAGCGDGRNLKAFSEAGFEVVGVDSSDQALKRVKNVHNDITVLNADIRRLDYVEEFDVVLCDYFLMHMEDQKEIITKFYNLLKSDGLLIAQFLSINDPSFGEGEKYNSDAFLKNEILTRYNTKEEIRELLGGFEILEIQELSHNDPDHVEDFPRARRHTHVSIYVLAKK